MDSNICGFLTPFSISQYVENLFLETTNTFYLKLSTLIVVPTHFFYHRYWLIFLGPEIPSHIFQSAAPAPTPPFPAAEQGIAWVSMNG